MASEFRLQDPGEGIHEADVVEIHVSPGDSVHEGDVVFVVETDKAAVEVPAPFTGTVESVAVEQDERVEVGDVLLTYHEDGAEAGQSESGESESGESESGESESGEADENRRAEEGGQREETSKQTDGGSGQDTGGDTGEDTDGDTGEDTDEARAEAAVAAGGGGGVAGPTNESVEGRRAGKPQSAGPVLASPSTRRLARELGVSLDAVKGSGPAGRVTAEDVRAEAAAETGAGEEATGKEAAEKETTGEGAAGEGGTREQASSGPAEGAASGAGSAAGAQSAAGTASAGPAGPTLVERVPELPDFEQWGEVERTPLRSVRRTIAERMTVAWSRIPHVTHQDVADITDLEAFRQEHAAEVEEEGGSLTLTTLVLKAAVAALREHPRFNASLDVAAKEIVLKHYYHMGVAVHTDRGLTVPVIRDVDRKSVVQLAVELTELAERTRNGDIKPGDTRGATFTLTNPGTIGGTGFTPIVNWPQVAILGTGRARLMPTVVENDGEPHIEPRLRLPLVLAFDHRVNDGADAARFVRTVVQALEDPQRLLLEA